MRADAKLCAAVAYVIVFFSTLADIYHIIFTALTGAPKHTNLSVDNFRLSGHRAYNRGAANRISVRNAVHLLRCAILRAILRVQSSLQVDR